MSCTAPLHEHVGGSISDAIHSQYNSNPPSFCIRDQQRAALCCEHSLSTTYSLPPTSFPHLPRKHAGWPTCHSHHRQGEAQHVEVGLPPACDDHTHNHRNQGHVGAGALTCSLHACTVYLSLTVAYGSLFAAARWEASHEGWRWGSASALWVLLVPMCAPAKGSKVAAVARSQPCGCCWCPCASLLRVARWQRWRGAHVRPC